MGVIIGDLNSRRGRIEGVEHRAGSQVIKSLVPLGRCSLCDPHAFSTQGRATSPCTLPITTKRRAPVTEEIIPRYRANRQQGEPDELHTFRDRA